MEDSVPLEVKGKYLNLECEAQDPGIMMGTKALGVSPFNSGGQDLRNSPQGYGGEDVHKRKL